MLALAPLRACSRGACGRSDAMLFISRLTLFWRRLGRSHCAPPHAGAVPRRPDSWRRVVRAVLDARVQLHAHVRERVSTHAHARACSASCNIAFWPHATRGARERGGWRVRSTPAPGHVHPGIIQTSAGNERADAGRVRRSAPQRARARGVKGNLLNAISLASWTPVQPPGSA